MRNLADFDVEKRELVGQEVPVYTLGSGPPVLILHELPGLTEAAVRLGRRVAKDGYRVIMPEFLPLRPGLIGQFRNTITVCLSRAFRAWAADEAGPFLDFVQKICRDEAGDRGIGVIGMCLTGGFALAAVADPLAKVRVPIICEPSLPFAFFGPKTKAFQMKARDIEKAKENLPAEPSGIACRFSNDCISPASRLAAIESAFKGLIDCRTLNSAKGNKDGYKRRAHSVLTEDFKDTAGTETRQVFDDMMKLFDKHLKTGTTG